MALSFNGTTLATNLDAVMFNGTAVSKVMFNGTEVWAKAVSLNWSGNSLISSNTGIEVSGNLFRARFFSGQGAWITAQANGTFTGDSTADSGSYNQYITLSTSGNLVRIAMGWEDAGAWVTYTAATKKFTGASQSGWNYTDYKGEYSNHHYFLQTSGGLIRFHQVFNRSGYSGAYISLT